MYSKEANKKIRYLVITIVATLFIASGTLAAKLLKSFFRPQYSSEISEEIHHTDNTPSSKTNIKRKIASTQNARSQPGYKFESRQYDNSATEEASSTIQTTTHEVSETIETSQQSTLTKMISSNSQSKAGQASQQDAKENDGIYTYTGSDVPCYSCSTNNSTSDSSDSSSTSDTTTTAVVATSQAASGFAASNGSLVYGVTGGGYRVSLSIGEPLSAITGTSSSGNFNIWLNAGSRSVSE